MAKSKEGEPRCADCLEKLVKTYTNLGELDQIWCKNCGMKYERERVDAKSK